MGEDRERSLARGEFFLGVAVVIYAIGVALVCTLTAPWEYADTPAKTAATAIMLIMCWLVVGVLAYCWITDLWSERKRWMR